MLRKLFLQNFQLIQYRGFCAPAKVIKKEKYDILAGVLIERLPIITKKLNDLENEVLTMMKKIEFENSLKSDHELRKEKELRQAELIKAGKVAQEADPDARTLQSAQDFEDLCSEELTKFQTAPRETEDDKKKNIKSLDRKLDDTLLFVCDHKLGKENIFLLPQGKWQEGETLRQTAERVAKEKCGTDIKLHFYGNAPVGFYRYKYPLADRKETVGAKVFFFRAIYKSGKVTADDKQKYMWISDDEMKPKLKDNYYNAVKSMLVT